MYASVYCEYLFTSNLNGILVRTFERRALKQRPLGLRVYDVGTPQTTRPPLPA